jgi:flagellar protein FliO/FliZ
LLLRKLLSIPLPERVTWRTPALAVVAAWTSLGQCVLAAAAEQGMKPASAPGVPLGEVASVGSLTQVTAALVLVVIAILAVAWILRRLSGATQIGSGSLRIVGGITLGTKERVVLLEAGETQMLVGVTPGQLRTLHVFDKPVVFRSAEHEPDQSFAGRLGALLQGRGQP